MKSPKGQVVVEYILLLSVAVVFAVMITKMVVSRSDNPEEQGFLIRAWSGWMQVIGSDLND